MSQVYLEPTEESGRAFFSQQIEGAVVMLNLLRLRALADYSLSPELAPDTEISGHSISITNILSLFCDKRVAVFSFLGMATVF